MRSVYIYFASLLQNLIKENLPKNKRNLENGNYYWDIENVHSAISIKNADYKFINYCEYLTLHCAVYILDNKSSEETNRQITIPFHIEDLRFYFRFS